MANKLVIVSYHEGVGNHHTAEIQEQLRRRGFQDNSYLGLTLASHVWSLLCGGTEYQIWGSERTEAMKKLAEEAQSRGQKEPDIGNYKVWGDKVIREALDCIKVRLAEQEERFALLIKD